MDSNALIATLGVGLIAGIGPTLAGLAAWRAAQANASQASVDALSDRLDEHTAQDHISFEALDQQAAVLTEGQARLQELVASIAVDRFDAAQEAVRVAAVLSEVAKQRHDELVQKVIAGS